MPYPDQETFEQSYPNITGTAISPDGDTIIALVTKKVPVDDLAQYERIPGAVRINGKDYMTDVVEVGIPHLIDVATSKTVPADHRKRHRPIPGGVSVGNSSVGAGTIGSPLLEHDGDPVVLTNSHVAGSSEYHYQPAAMDGGNESEPIGTLREASELNPDEPQTTDSALLDVDPDIISDEILGLGELVDFGEVEVGRDYAKAGRTTGVTRSPLRGLDASVRVAYGDKTLRFTGIEVFDDMSAPGDSGSLIGYETDDGEGFVATSLLFAGSDKITLAIPIQAVMDYHGDLEIYGEDEDGDNGGDSDPIDWGEFCHPATLDPDEDVIDGDTLDFPTVHLGLEVDKHNERIRLLGIDTAEIHHGVVEGSEEYELGMEQKRFVEEWLSRGVEEYEGEYPFVLDTYEDKRDSFGRLLTHVYRRSDGQSLADSLIDVYGDDVRYSIAEQIKRFLR